MVSIFGIEFLEVGSYWGPIVASIIMLVGAGIAWLFTTLSRRTAPQNPTKEKLTTYACGEDVVQERKNVSDIEVQETRPSGEMFFSPIREVFRGFYDQVRSGHTGDLSTYLIWLVFGIVMLIVLIYAIYITGL